MRFKDLYIAIQNMQKYLQNTFNDPENNQEKPKSRISASLQYGA